MSGIHVVGARCERCGHADDSNQTLDTYLNRHDGDRLVTLCKNAQMCAERMVREKIQNDPSVSARA